MKIQSLAVLVCMLYASPVAAQVANDDCANAQELDLILTSATCWMSGQPSQLVVDSTDLAVPNFPYPSNPGACFGYWAVPNVPANDRWYRFLLSSGHYVEYTCTALDSLQLSWWQGNDCTVLTPLDCSTLLPGEVIQRLRTGAYHPGIDTLYLQIASTSISSDARFEFCYKDTWWGITPITYGTALPTPVLCLVHQMNILSASSSSAADGSVDIDIIEGNGPFSIAWADGNTQFHRTDLLSGIYPFILTDSTGCQQMDTVTVGVELPTGYSSFGPGVSITHALDNATLEIRTPTEALPGRYSITDVLGRTLVSQEMHGTLTSVDLELLRSQLVILLIRDAQGVPLLIRKLHL